MDAVKIDIFSKLHFLGNAKPRAQPESGVPRPDRVRVTAVVWQMTLTNEVESRDQLPGAVCLRHISMMTTPAAHSAACAAKTAHTP